jgi:hypothetical protein
MPLAVHEILSGGYGYLSTIPGFENLEYEFMEDPGVRSYLEKYARLR